MCARPGVEGNVGVCTWGPPDLPGESSPLLVAVECERVVSPAHQPSNVRVPRMALFPGSRGMLLPGDPARSGGGCPRVWPSQVSWAMFRDEGPAAGPLSIFAYFFLGFSYLHTTPTHLLSRPFLH